MESSGSHQKPLWRESPPLKSDGQSDTAQGHRSSCMPCRASEPAIKQEERGDGQDSTDELDKLTAQFEQEAAQQKAAAVQAKGKVKQQAKSMRERREEGLAAPLDSDNR